MPAISNYAPMGYQQLTSLATATGLTVPDRAARAVIAVESASVRWRDDGVDPTGTVGMPLAAGSVMEYQGDLDQLRFIESSVGAKINVAYYSN